MNTGSAGLPTLMRSCRLCLPALPVLLTISAAWLIYGVPPDEALRYVSFEILYTLAPGCLVYLAIAPAARKPLATLAIGWPLGYAMSVGAFALTAALNVRPLFSFLPLAVAIPTLPALLYTRKQANLSTSRPAYDGHAARLSRTLLWLFSSLLISTAVALQAVTMFPRLPLPPFHKSVSYVPDNMFYISVAAEARHHWPITTPWVAGLPLHYYTAVFIHGAAINQVAGVELTTIYFRLLPIVLAVLGAIQLWFIANSIGRSPAAGSLSIAIFFFVSAADLNPARPLPLESESLASFTETPTFGLGVVFLLGLISLIVGHSTSNRASARASVRRLPQMHWTAVLLMLPIMLACTATKTFAAADFVGGAALYWLWGATKRAYSRSLSFILFLSISSIAVIYFGLIAGGDAQTQHLQPFAYLLQDHLPRHSEDLARALVGSYLWIPLVIVAVIVLLVCLSAPLLGLIWLWLRRVPLLASELICIFTYLAGLLACMLFGGSIIYGHTTGSEYYFLYIGYVVIVPVAAGGWAMLWSETPTRARRPIVAASLGVLLLGLVIAGGSRLLPMTPHGRNAWYLAMYVLIIVIIGLTAVGLGHYYRTLLASQRYRVLACCIPLIGILGFVKTAGNTVAVLRDASGRPPVPARYAGNLYTIDPALYRGLTWVRFHTPACAVFAVNTNDPLASHVYYSALTERRFFFETAGYTPEILTGKPPFVARQLVNYRATVVGNPVALRQLAREGVGYILIDKSHGTGAAVLSRVTQRIFHNEAVDVYRLRQRLGRDPRFGCRA